MEDKREQVECCVINWLALWVHFEDNLRKAKFDWIANDVEEAVPALLQSISIQSKNDVVVLGKVLSTGQV